MRSLLVLFVAVTFFAAGEGLTCYECNWTQSGCNDTFESEGTEVKKMPCLTDGNFCVKASVELDNGTVYVYRSCKYHSSIKHGPDRAADHARAVSATERYCYTDLCNGASPTSAALSILMVIAVPFGFANYHLVMPVGHN